MKRPALFNPVTLSAIFPWLIQGILFLFLSLLFLVLYYSPVNLTNADIGRHIQNGRLFVEEGVLVNTNFYSYTQPDKEVVNHHWGSGVFFHGIFDRWGYEGLVWIYAAIGLLTLWIFFGAGVTRGGFVPALISAVVALPMMVSRTEIRPEGLSALLLGIFLWLCLAVDANKVNRRWLWMLVPLQIVWVNLHIFFIFGPFVVGCFALKDWAGSPSVKTVKPHIPLICALTAACFVNPNGLYGFLTPLTIFEEYGYMLAENQSVFFMQNRFPDNPLYLHFEISVALLALGILGTVKAWPWRGHVLTAVLLGFFTLLAFRTNRAIQLFGFVMIPFLASFLECVFRRIRNPWSGMLRYSLGAAAGIMLLLSVLVPDHYYTSLKAKRLAHLVDAVRTEDAWFAESVRNIGRWPALLPGNNASAEFFLQQDIKGPVFNNYDIGGFLIFHLYPRHRVFVDNRPEAYSVDFFKELYIPMQEDEDIWRQELERFGFNAIYFYRHDMTPWAQPFLIRRIKDPEWAPVFVDAYTILLLRRTRLNAAIIQKYELPPALFQFTG